MKIGFIGCGGHAFKVYADSLRRIAAETPALDLFLCCDIDAEKALRFAQEAGFARSSGDPADALASGACDALILATPYPITAGLAARSLRAGIPTLMEKPPGGTLEQAESVARAAKESGTPHQVAFNRRHIPLIRALKQDILSENAALQHIDYAMYRVDRREDHFYSTAVHGVDLISHLASSPFKRVSLHYARMERFGGGVENILMQSSFVSGASAQLSFCPVSGVLTERLVVTTDAATYYVNLPIWNAGDPIGSIAKYREDRLLWERTGDEVGDGPNLFENNGFYAQLHSFLADIAQGRAPADDIHSALDTMRIMDCMRLRQASYCRAES